MFKHLPDYEEGINYDCTLDAANSLVLCSISLFFLHSPFHLAQRFRKVSSRTLAPADSYTALSSPDFFDFA